jgi:hypothetical protein
MVEKIIYLVWFGEINPTRQASIDSFINDSGCKVVLITGDNLKDFEAEDYKMHPLFSNLSSVDKSDYLRAYLMYNYGGGYSDVKKCMFDWSQYFDQLNNDNTIDFIACPLINEHGITNFSNDQSIVAKAKTEYYNYSSVAQFIFKPKTDIAKRWIDEIHMKLDKMYDILEKNPALHPYARPRGFVKSHTVDPEFVALFSNEYPIGWMDLAGNIFYKIQYDNGLAGYSLNMPQHQREAGAHRGVWNSTTAKYE